MSQADLVKMIRDKTECGFSVLFLRIQPVDSFILYNWKILATLSTTLAHMYMCGYFLSLYKQGHERS